MRQFRRSVSQYKAYLLKRDGYVSEILVREYAEARQKYKRNLRDGNFDVYLNDPNCKTCGKKKG